MLPRTCGEKTDVPGVNALGCVSTIEIEHEIVGKVNVTISASSNSVYLLAPSSLIHNYTSKVKSQYNTTQKLNNENSNDINQHGNCNNKFADFNSYCTNESAIFSRKVWSVGQRAANSVVETNVSLQERVCETSTSKSVLPLPRIQCLTALSLCSKHHTSLETDVVGANTNNNQNSAHEPIINDNDSGKNNYINEFCNDSSNKFINDCICVIVACYDKLSKPFLALIVFSLHQVLALQSEYENRKLLWYEEKHFPISHMLSHPLRLFSHPRMCTLPFEVSTETLRYVIMCSVNNSGCGVGKNDGNNHIGSDSSSAIAHVVSSQTKVFPALSQITNFVENSSAYFSGNVLFLILEVKYGKLMTYLKTERYDNTLEKSVATHVINVSDMVDNVRGVNNGNTTLTEECAQERREQFYYRDSAWNKKWNNDENNTNSDYIVDGDNNNTNNNEHEAYHYNNIQFSVTPPSATLLPLPFSSSVTPFSVFKAHWLQEREQQEQQKQQLQQSNSHSKEYCGEKVVAYWVRSLCSLDSIICSFAVHENVHELLRHNCLLSVNSLSKLSVAPESTLCAKVNGVTRNINCNCEVVNANASNSRSNETNVRYSSDADNNNNSSKTNNVYSHCTKCLHNENEWRESYSDCTYANKMQRCSLSVHDNEVVLAAVGTIDGKIYLVSSHNPTPVLIKRLAGPIADLTFMYINVTAMISNMLGNTVRSYLWADNENNQTLARSSTEDTNNTNKTCWNALHTNSIITTNRPCDLRCMCSQFTCHGELCLIILDCVGQVVIARGLSDSNAVQPRSLRFQRVADVQQFVSLPVLTSASAKIQAKLETKREEDDETSQDHVTCENVSSHIDDVNSVEANDMSNHHNGKNVSSVSVQQVNELPWRVPSMTNVRDINSLRTLLRPKLHASLPVSTSKELVKKRSSSNNAEIDNTNDIVSEHSDNELTVQDNKRSFNSPEYCNTSNITELTEPNDNIIDDITSNTHHKKENIGSDTSNAIIASSEESTNTYSHIDKYNNDEELLTQDTYCRYANPEFWHTNNNNDNVGSKQEYRHVNGVSGHILSRGMLAMTPPRYLISLRCRNSSHLLEVHYISYILVSTLGHVVAAVKYDEKTDTFTLANFIVTPTPVYGMCYVDGYSALHGFNEYPGLLFAGVDGVLAAQRKPRFIRSRTSLLLRILQSRLEKTHNTQHEDASRESEEVSSSQIQDVCSTELLREVVFSLNLFEC